MHITGRLRDGTGRDTTMVEITMAPTTKTAVATKGGVTAVGWTAEVSPREAAIVVDPNLGKHHQSTARPFLFQTGSAPKPSLIPIFKGFNHVLPDNGSQRIEMSPFAHPKILVPSLWTQPKPGAAKVTCDNCGLRGHLEKSCKYDFYGPIYLWWLQQAVLNNRQAHSGSTP